MTTSPGGERSSEIRDTAMDAVTDATWEAEVLRRRGTVLVDLAADWCPSCPAFSSLLREVAQKHPTARVRHLDVDINPFTVQTYGVTSVPTLLVFSDGNLVRRLVGSRQPQRLRQELAPYLE